MKARMSIRVEEKYVVELAVEFLLTRGWCQAHEPWAPAVLSGRG